jgi:tRNA dimethylallyltransferase
VKAFALRIAPEVTAERVARRVDAQFEQGLLDEIRGLLASGVPPTAHPFTGLVYRQALEHLHGVRDEAATRDLIVRENRRYARRQLIWFRKEPNLQWIHAAGEREATQDEAARAITALEKRFDGPDT